MSGKSRHTDGSPEAPPELRVYRLGDRSWAWCYVEPATGIQLHSNTTYGGAEEAAAAACAAYPDLRVAGEPGDSG